MKANANLARFGEALLSQVDNLSYNLDKIGIENQINRHNLIATVMLGQKRIEGEMDSLTARVDVTKANLESLKTLVEQYAKSGVSLATFPATYSYERIKSLA